MLFRLGCVGFWAPLWPVLLRLGRRFGERSERCWSLEVVEGSAMGEMVVQMIEGWRGWEEF